MRLALAFGVVAFAVAGAGYVHERRVTLELPTCAREGQLNGPPRNCVYSGPPMIVTQRPSWQDPAAVLLVLAGLAAAVILLKARWSPPVVRPKSSSVTTGGPYIPGAGDDHEQGRAARVADRRARNLERFRDEWGHRTDEKVAAALASPPERKVGLLVIRLVAAIDGLEEALRRVEKLTWALVALGEACRKGQALDASQVRQSPDESRGRRDGQ
jgi:hypothetical protein